MPEDNQTPPPPLRAVTMDDLVVLRDELRREMRGAVKEIESLLVEAANRMDERPLQRAPEAAELLELQPVQCQTPGCGTLLMDGVCPRCTHPRAAPPVPKHARGQCRTPGCGCVLDERGLCPRCYPAAPPPLA